MEKLKEVFVANTSRHQPLYHFLALLGFSLISATAPWHLRRHPHVVQLLEIIETKNQLYLIMAA